jgi:hypothetical protein
MGHFSEDYFEVQLKPCMGLIVFGESTRHVLFKNIFFKAEFDRYVNFLDGPYKTVGSEIHVSVCP